MILTNDCNDFDSRMYDDFDLIICGDFDSMIREDFVGKCQLLIWIVTQDARAEMEYLKLEYKDVERDYNNFLKKLKSENRIIRQVISESISHRRDLPHAYNFALVFRVGILHWRFTMAFRVGISRWNFAPQRLASRIQLRVGILRWHFTLAFRVGISRRRDLSHAHKLASL